MKQQHVYPASQRRQDVVDHGPRIVCLCGSTKFKDQFLEEAKRITMTGSIVLSVGWFSHQDEAKPTREEKAKLDVLHLHKIDLCHEVRVVDVDKYIGESTEREIAYARSIGRPITYLSEEEFSG